VETSKFTKKGLNELFSRSCKERKGRSYAKKDIIKKCVLYSQIGNPE